MSIIKNSMEDYYLFLYCIKNGKRESAHQGASEISVMDRIGLWQILNIADFLFDTVKKLQSQARELALVPVKCHFQVTQSSVCKAKFHLRCTCKKSGNE